jgi:SAM-dependent methyltransferase
VPTIDENRRRWNEHYTWEEAGDEWSSHWGGTESEWRCTLLPRIAAFIPADTICEIAPGFGRWSQYLIGLSDHYVGIDLARPCVEACRERFASAGTARFEVNDGESLPTVGDSSVDFVFSFDSLVHVEDTVISAYLSELARVLTPNGIALIHHSNLAEYVSDLVDGEERADWEHWRARSMTAERFEQLSLEWGLSCIGQEIINWGSARLIDCVSLVTKPGSKWDRPNVVARNEHFMAEGQSAQAVSQVYTSLAYVDDSAVVRRELQPVTDASSATPVASVRGSAEVGGTLAEIRRLQTEVDQYRNSRLFRYTLLPRRIYAALRRRSS